MSYLYQKNISGDFSANTVSAGLLSKDIKESPLSSAELEYVTVDHDDDQCLICLSVEPNNEDKTTLDQVCSDYTGDIESPLVISDLVDADHSSNDHRTIDYKTALLKRLHKVVSNIYRGEVREVKYYTDHTENELVITVRVCSEESCENLGYVRNNLGQPIERWTERTWHKKDGTPHKEKKVTHKRYDHDSTQQMKEGMRRRTNVIDKMSVDILTAHVVTTAVNPMSPTDEEKTASYNVVTSYFEKYSSDISTFTRTGRNAFLTAPNSPNVTDDTDGWLDNDVSILGYPSGWTIRTIILESVRNINR